MKISAKGQVVIPAPIRQKYGWKPGVKVVVKEARPMEVVFKKRQPEESLGEKYRGSLKDVLPSIEEYLTAKKEELKLEE